MKVYIATSFHDKELARTVAIMFEETGHVVTCEWWKSKEPSQEEAEKDLEGIRNADVVVGLFLKPFVYKGSIFELGYAHGLMKRIFIVGDELDSMVFMFFPNITKAKSVNQVIKLLKGKIKWDDPT